jgi:uncharacterized protein involved in outer membrane biogenesis
MKKKILLSLLSLFILVATGAGFALYKLNDIVSTFRPQIEQQLSTALGAQVQLGEISASIFPTCHLSVKEVKVLAADGKAAALSLGGLTASVALRPLLSKKLDISNLEIERPQITLIKDASGTTVQGLAPAKSSVKLSVERILKSDRYNGIPHNNLRWGAHHR